MLTSTTYMGSSFLSILILSCKIISLICLLISVYSYHWFHIENYSMNKNSIKELCKSYGVFCNLDEQMPLPRLIVILPCVISFIGLLLETINLCLFYPIRQHVRSMLNFFLEQTSIALSCAITIHCIWVVIVHIRISMEMSIVHLDWAFYAFGIATILIPIDCICSIIRTMYNCQHENNSQTKHHIQIYSCRNRSIIESDN